MSWQKTSRLGRSTEWASPGREFKKLKKECKKTDLKKKIESWKKEGYKMFETEKEIGKISKQGIKKHITEWKKEGYDTSILDK